MWLRECLELASIPHVESSEVLHPIQAQRYANLAVQDGLDGETLEALASLAAYGRHPQNASRDLHRFIPNAYGSGLASYDICIKAWDGKNMKLEETKIPVLLASDTLRAIWNSKSSKVWKACLGASAESCEAYWQKAASTWAHSHPVVTNGYHAETIPDTWLGSARLPRSVFSCVSHTREPLLVSKIRV